MAGPEVSWFSLVDFTGPPSWIHTAFLPPETTFRNPWGLADLVLFLERFLFVSAAAAAAAGHSSVITWSLLSRTGLS